MSVAIEPAKRSRSAAGFDRMLAFATKSHGRAVASLVLVCLLALLPGFFSIPPIDRDEARFAQASKQMVETGDYIDIRFQEQSRYKKPVGIYWLQAAVVNAAEAAGVPQARTQIWLYRIPSLLGAIGAVLLTYWAALAFVSRRAAVLAGLMLASCVLLGVEARLATTDAMLLLTAVAAMGALGRAYLAERGAYAGDGHPLLTPAVFWTALAVGMLIKGPLVLLFAALAAGMLAVLDRSARFFWRLRPAAGLGLMLVIVLPWFIAIIARSGMAFFDDSLGGDFLAKVGAAQETHWGPPGYYFALFWLCFFPAAMLVPLAGGAVWRARLEPRTKFLLAWVIPAWIVFEMAMTKLPHYVLPLYPAIAILVAGVIERGALAQARWLRSGTVWWPILIGLGALGTVALNIAVAHQPGFAAWPFAAAAVFFAASAWWRYGADGAEISFLRAATAAILFYAALLGATFPAIDKLFPSREIARLVTPAPCKDPTYMMAGYHEPSLVFLVATNLQPGNGRAAADFLAGGGCRFAFVEQRQEPAFLARAEAIGLRYSAGPRVEGFNISSGREVSIAIYREAGR